MPTLTITPEAARNIAAIRELSVLAARDGDAETAQSAVNALHTLLTWGGNLRIMSDGDVSLYCEQRTDDDKFLMNFGIIGTPSRKGEHAYSWTFHS